MVIDRDKKNKKRHREVVGRITSLRKGPVKKVGWDGGYQGAETVGEVLVKEQKISIRALEDPDCASMKT